MRERAKAAVALGLCVSAAAASLAFNVAAASTASVAERAGRHADGLAGSRIIFLVPVGTPIEGGDGFDSFTFIGQSLGRIDVGSCSAEGPYHVHNGVLTPGPNSSKGASILTGLIPFTSEAMRAGTHLDHLQIISSCEGNGVAYDKWVGTIRE